MRQSVPYFTRPMGSWAGRVTLMIFCPLIHAAPPELHMASGPLPDGNRHPSLMVGLAIDPSAAALAYQAAPYDRTAEYAGYFNPRKCYRYAGGIHNGFFEISRDADPLHECGNRLFSGNFMNWATMSSLDLLRQAFTGGQRVIDTAELTVLQRAWLPEHVGLQTNAATHRILSGAGNASAPARVTPFDIDTLYIVSCRDKVVFSETAGRSAGCNVPASTKQHGFSQGDKPLGEYLARIKVCDRNEAMDRPGLCQRYSRYYKPVGRLQQHAAQARFALAGYPGGDSLPRLLAPLKYIGPSSFSGQGLAFSYNPLSEWNGSTGIFTSSSSNEGQGDADPGSGIIHHLHQPGIPDASLAANAASLVYLTGLQYLQDGLVKSGTTGAAKAMHQAGPPAQSSLVPSCQRNLIALITNQHGKPLSPAQSLSRMRIEEMDSWTRKVLEMETDLHGAYHNPAPRRSLARLLTEEDGRTSISGYSVAGMAYRANIQGNQQRIAASSKTFVIDIAPGPSDNDDVRDKPLYLAAKYGGFEDRNADGNPFISGRAAGASETGYVEWGAHGIAENYFLVQQPAQIADAVATLFARLDALRGTMGGVALAAISSETATLYQPGYYSFQWSGSLKKIQLRIDKRGISGREINWDAADILTGNGNQGPVPVPEQRNIYTLGAGGRMVGFKWDELSAEQRWVLDISPRNGQPDGLGQQRLDYLRGVRKLEIGQPQGIFRSRSSILGDIVHSNPIYVASTRHASVAVAGSSRTVYVGANDGMLHAFDADSGRELFAYIPNALFAHLPLLTDPGYVHRPYVDGMQTASEALLAGEVRTVLAAGMGGGAQGVFALDITEPGRFGSAAGALWEFTDRDDPDIGYVTGPPVIARFRTGESNGAVRYRFFVVVSSGLNNYSKDGAGRFSASGQSALFLLALDKSRDERWLQGVNYYKFSVPVTDASLPNGLSAPRVVPGSDGVARFVYAGDLQGNLWRFDFGEPQRWTGTSPRRPVASLLFTARDSAGRRQPISSQPQVAFAHGSGYMVLFGTGRFIEDADAAPANFGMQSFYAIHDRLEQGYKVSARKELAERIVVPVRGNDSGPLAIVPAATLAGGGNKGWYFDFPESERSGERSVSTPVLAYGRLFFTTLIPAKDGCDAGGRTYSLNALTGLPVTGNSTGYLSKVGLPGPPVLLNMITDEGSRDAAGKKVVTRRLTVVNTGTGGAEGHITPVNVDDERGSLIALPSGRLSWREIPNWQELHNALRRK